MRKKTTLSDISQQLGISVTAVSKALRGHESISSDTRQLVIETAKRLDYKGQPAAKREALATLGKICIVLDQRVMTDPYTMSACFQMDSVLKAHGLESAVHGIPAFDPYEDVIANIKSTNPAGIFLFGRFPAKIAEELHGGNTPIITLDGDFPYFPVDSVLPNDYYGAFLAVRHLVQAGHLQIGFIGDNTLSSTFRARYHGFCDALEHWGIDHNPKYIYNLRLQDSYSEAQFHVLQEKLDYDNLPTAFFCANDPIAIVLNNTLNTRGIYTPDDISIIGFDNLDACEWQSPPLTTLNYPREQIAKRAVDLMLWRLDNLDAPCNKILVYPELVIRKSVAPPRK